MIRSLSLNGNGRHPSPDGLLDHIPAGVDPIGTTAEPGCLADVPSRDRTIGSTLKDVGGLVAVDAGSMARCPSLG